MTAPKQEFIDDIIHGMHLAKYQADVAWKTKQTAINAAKMLDEGIYLGLAGQYVLEIESDCEPAIHRIRAVSKEGT
jgi:hypothetical protein